MANNLDAWYISQLAKIEMGQGYERGDKVSLVQQTYSHDLGESLPLLKVKPVPWRTALKEFAWFCSPDFDYRRLEQTGVTWWRPWVAKLLPEAADGKLELTEAQLPYKKLWLGTTRILQALAKGDHDSTRLYCSLWPEEGKLSEALLPPCALSHQVTVTDKLNLSVYQRSADLLCGVPSNLIQYAWLASVYAKAAGKPLGQLTFHYGDLHVYKQHLAVPEYQQLLGMLTPEVSEMPPVRKFELMGISRDLIAAHMANVQCTTLSGEYVRKDFPRFPVVEVYTGNKVAQ